MNRGAISEGKAQELVEAVCCKVRDQFVAEPFHRTPIRDDISTEFQGTNQTPPLFTNHVQVDSNEEAQKESLENEGIPETLFEIKKTQASSDKLVPAGETPSPQKTYVEALNTNPSCLFKPALQKPHPIGQKEGCPAITFSKIDLKQAEGLRTHAIVAKCVQGSYTFDKIKPCLVETLGIATNTILGQIDNRHILIKTSELDMNKVLARISCTINSAVFRFSRWYSSFDPKKDNPKVIKWLKLPNLPIALFAEQCLKQIADSMGTLIQIDARTINHSFFKHARICVEVDSRAQLPTKIWICTDEDTGKGFWQELS